MARRPRRVVRVDGAAEDESSAILRFRKFNNTYGLISRTYS